MKTGNELQYAVNLANKVLEILTPVTLPGRLHIAGSIRRLSPRVGDIEIVAGPLSRTKFELHFYQNFKVPIKRDARLVKFNFETMQVDLFIPQPHDYFRQLAIRTGSADFAHHIIARQWSRKGWVGTKDGLRKADECLYTETPPKDGKGYPKKVYYINPELDQETISRPPAWESEEAFFDWLKIDMPPPELRNYIVNNFLGHNKHH